ncbi:MAG TPA: energy transducer TonB [Polyangiaceae bacterium]|nr:energy transducer TonB [Polyangiaceae bacterium]
MRLPFALLGLVCVACPPPAMNPTPDPMPTVGTATSPTPDAGSIPPASAGTSTAQGTPADAAAPPLSTPNPLVKRSDAAADTAPVPAKINTDEDALRAIGERAQSCAEQKRIALPPSKPLWVRMMLSVDTDGSVTDLRLSGTSGLPALDECATAAARAVRFPPRAAPLWLEAPIGFQENSSD